MGDTRTLCFVPLLEAVKGAVRRKLVARAGGIDLTQLDRVPDRLTWPLDRVIAEKMPICGYHFPFPGAGTISKDGAGYALELMKA